MRNCLLRLLGRAAVRRFLTFGAVGASGVVINTGTLMVLASLGFNALSWPIWVATELSILWNYQLHRHITWRDRACGRWWVYNLAAWVTASIAIGVTSSLVYVGHMPLWLASLSGTAVGMGINYVLFDRVVFASLVWISVRFNLLLRPYRTGT